MPRRPAVLLAFLVASCVMLLAAPSCAAAQAAEPRESFEVARMVREAVDMGALPAPAFGIALPFFSAQMISNSQQRWFDRTWGYVELALGVLGSGYSAWLLAAHVDESSGVVTTYSYSAALAMNLRLITHGALSAALYDDSVDSDVRVLLPSISVAPVREGAVASFTWVI